METDDSRQNPPARAEADQLRQVDGAQARIAAAGPSLARAVTICLLIPSISARSFLLPTTGWLASHPADGRIGFAIAATVMSLVAGFYKRRWWVPLIGTLNLAGLSLFLGIASDLASGGVIWLTFGVFFLADALLWSGGLRRRGYRRP